MEAALHVEVPTAPAIPPGDDESLRWIQRPLAVPTRGGPLVSRFLWRPLWILGRGFHGLFALVCLLALLSAVTAVPVLHLAVLGYLFDVEGRVARTGRILCGFPLIEHAPRLGSAALGIWLMLLPVRFFSTLAADARILDPASVAARNLGFLTRASALLVFVHILLALARGGRLISFFRPLHNARWFWRNRGDGTSLGGLADRLTTKVGNLRPVVYFLMGLRGFLGSLLWLVPPTFLFAVADRTQGGAFVITLVGAIMLAFVLSWLPFLQAHVAAENRFGAFFELRAARRIFPRAPIASLLAVVVTLALPFPLYLSRVIVPPRDAVWLITVIFVLALYPGRLLAGWAYHRATSREKPAFFLLRWVCRLLLAAFLAYYVFFFFFTQFVGEHGKGILFEHHAFLLRIGF